jgi:hypothetical protein
MNCIIDFLIEGRRRFVDVSFDVLKFKPLEHRYVAYEFMIVVESFKISHDFTIESSIILNSVQSYHLFSVIISKIYSGRAGYRSKCPGSCIRFSEDQDRFQFASL